VYRGRIVSHEGEVRRFRLLLFAALPDRVHGEILSPLGNPQLIVDGGGGQLAITFVRDAESFVGPARVDVLARILGVRLDLHELAGALLTGEASSDDRRVERVGNDVPGLPETFTVGMEGASLALELKRLRPLTADPTVLGTGRPPRGTRVRPLEALEAEGERLERLAAEEEEP
jgi:hypothetical protein